MSNIVWVNGENEVSSRSHIGCTTPKSLTPPPTVACPTCHGISLEYMHSVVSDEKTGEQWDQFVCLQCDRAYEYSHSNGRLALVLDAVGSCVRHARSEDFPKWGPNGIGAARDK